MTEITEGLTPAQFITALNGNIPFKDAITDDMLTGELITKFHSNYDYIAAIDSEIAVKTSLSIGMSGAAYIDALNQNFNNIDSNLPCTETIHVIPDNRGAEYNFVMDNFYVPTVIKLADGNTLIGCLSRGGVTFSRENFNIIKSSEGYSAPVLIGFDEASTGTYDSHAKAAFIEKEGIIYCIHEALDGVSATNAGNHNSPFVIKKSLDDGATWSEVSRIDEEICYPKVFLISGVFYLVTRNDARYIFLYKSTDNCATWTKLSNVFLADVTGGAYNSIPAGVDDEIHIIVTLRVGLAGTGVWGAVAHLRSSDGITYYNSGKTWSKNVTTGGPVSQTELITNCLIGTSTTTPYNVIYHGGFIKNDKLYSLISYGESILDPDTEILAQTTYSSCKIYEGDTELLDVSELVAGAVYDGYSADGCLKFMRNDDTFDIIQFDLANSNDIILHNYNNTTKLSSKLLRIGVTDPNDVAIGAFTWNTTNRSGRILVMGKVTGDMLDLVNSYSDLIVFEFK
jgi:hypothetical protein